MKANIGIALGLLLAGMVVSPLAFADPVAIEVTDDAGAALKGDPTHGEVVFHKCQVCHSIKAGDNRVGPSLHGVIGRTAGTAEGYTYSAANKGSGIVWNEQKIFVYLKNPQATVPGTKMSFPGLPKPEDRADVIAYLQENAK